VLGNVSYKGFFEKERGIPEDSLLRAEGYDTEFAPTGGWSTLGWFTDPILSNMLRKNEGRLAEIIIHELTHATVYLKGSVDYNENLATFIGEQGAIRFLTQKYGAGATQLTNYVDIQADENVFGNYMVGACVQLDRLYATMTPAMKDGDKSQWKQEKIRAIIQGINDLKLHHPERYQFTNAEEPLPNNAWFMSYKRYRNEQGDFYHRLHGFGDDLRLFINDIKQKAGK
jgi:predicted aminopeptidase